MNGFRLSPQQRHLLQSSGKQPLEERLVQVALRLPEAANLAALQEALERLVRRHEILRTSFPPVPGLEMPLQVPSDEPITPSISEADPSRTDAGRLDEGLRLVMQEDRAAGFDPARGDLFRVSSLSAGDHFLIWTQSALLGDGVSAINLLADLLSDSTGGDATPDDEPMQYADLAEWMHEILEDEDAKAAQRAWQRTLDGAPDPRLALEREADAETGSLAVVSVDLEEDTLAALKNGRDSGPSLEAKLYALWAVLICRFTDASDSLLGTLFDGRSYEGLEDAAGLFARYLPVRVELRSGEPVHELARRLAEQCGEVAELQEYFAWETVPAEAGPPDYCFAYHPFSLAAEASGVEIAAGYISLEPHLLQLSCYELADGPRLEISYDRTRLGRAAAESIARSFEALCHGAVTRVETAAIELSLVASAEPAAPVAAAGDIPSPALDRLLPQLIGERAADRADHPAVVCGADSVSYAELWERAGRIASHLRGRGLGAGTIVGICCVRSADLVAAVVGVQRSGAAYLPLDPTYPTDRLAFMVGDAGAEIVVGHDRTSEITAMLGVEVADIGSLDRDASDPPFEARPENLAYVIYTSGSTGTPKGVGVSHANLLHSTMAREHVYDEAPERFLLLSSYAFDSSIVGIFWTLSTGGTLVLPEEGDEQDVGLLADLVEERSVTHTLCLPTLYNVLVDQVPAAKLATLRTTIVAGEACPLALAERHFERRGDSRLFNEYGPTEATVWATATRLTPDNVTVSVPIGRPIPYARVYLLDPAGQLLPAGVTGEIHIGGAGVTPGYLGRPEITAERFIPDPFAEGDSRLYRTGDLGSARLDGQIDFFGRADHQVKIRGYRIEPGEIEARLAEHAEIDQAVVVARAADGGDLRLVAYYVPEAGRSPTVSVLRAHLQENLPEYMIPAAWMALEQMPLTPNGKVDRKALPEPEQDRPDLAAEYEAPSTDLERYLVTRWGEVLGAEQIGVNDNFFELGGNSIQAAIFMNRLRGELEEFIHVGRLFENPTVRELAGFLEGEHGEAAGRLEAGSVATEAPIQASPEREAIERLDDMSDDEVDSLLEDLLAEEERST